MQNCAPANASYTRRDSQTKLLKTGGIDQLEFPIFFTTHHDSAEICFLVNNFEYGESNGNGHLVLNETVTREIKSFLSLQTPRLILNFSRLAVRQITPEGVDYLDYTGGILEPERPTDYILGANVAKTYALSIGAIRRSSELESLENAGQINFFQIIPEQGRRARGFMLPRAYLLSELNALTNR